MKEYLELLESSGIATEERDIARLEKIANDDGMIERSEFVSYAKRSNVFKSLQEESEKQHFDKAELAFKVSEVNITQYLILQFLHDF